MKYKTIYLDHAAATPIDPLVVKAMKPYFSQKFYNPSAQYLAAKNVAQDIALARSNVAKWLGARPSEIIFTAGGTEADNLVIHGIMQQYPGDNLIISDIEHQAVIEPAKRYDYHSAPVSKDGLVDIDSLVELIDEKTVLVSIMYANHEIGSIQPIKQIAKQLEVVRDQRQQAGNKHPLFFHVDACQAANYLDLHAKDLGVDLMTINSGKIYGPKQCGALFVRSGVTLTPQILGGGQEYGLRSGTENVANIIGFATALELAQTRRDQEVKRLFELQKVFINDLAKKLPIASVNGSTKHRLPNNIHITIAGIDNERLMMMLDEQGIQCAVGSACSASNDEPSHVLKAIGLSNQSARSSLRFTTGKTTTANEINQTLEVLVASCSQK